MITNPMTDLNEAGIAKAEASYMKRMGYGCMRPDEASALRAAITAYLEATGGAADHVDGNNAPFHTDLMVPPESLDAFMEANPLPLAPAPTPETREPSEGAVDLLINRVAPFLSELTVTRLRVNPRGREDFKEALRAAYAIDFPAAPKAEPNCSEIPKGWKLIPVDITNEMQDAYFEVIDKNSQRVSTDCRFGRYDSQREAYRAMLAAAPKAPSAEGWRPIESAPKDGTLIIVYRPTTNGEYIDKVSQDWWGLFGNGSRKTWARSNNAHQPTHWMPLPAPPMKGEKP